jgi:xanthine dehydrogenase accessory factor
MAFADVLVLIRGAGDLASGVAYRLVQAGFPVVMTELALPLAVRTTVSYSSCVPYNVVIIGGVIARRVALDQPEALQAALAAGEIPVLVDPDNRAIRALRPAVVIDGRVAKVNLDTRIDDAPLVIALGPGFVAGVDCHAVIETNRGHDLGRVLWQGSAEPNTGRPASVHEKSVERVLRAPTDGKMAQVSMIGLVVPQGALLARINGIPVIAPFEGVVRGLIDDETYVTTGMKIGDLDPRARRQHCFTISDKSLAVGGGAVEAVLAAPQVRELLRTSSQGG